MLNDFRTFTFFSLFWVVLGWLGFLSALAGFFYAWIFAAYFSLMLTAFLIFTIKNKRVINLKIISRLKNKTTGIVFILLSSILFFSFFSTPSIFSGRDQGSLSEAAIRLAQNHQLEFSTPASQEFFKIYGPGQALNFPGFFYTEEGNLITQFPLPYIAWLGIFYSLFGLGGLILANAILFFIFAMSFYFIFNRFFKKYAWLSLPFLLTFFPFFWFFKFTLTENMAMAFLWLGILQLLKLAEKNGINALNYWTTVLSFSLLFFARIEGVAFLAFALVVLVFNKKTVEYLKENYQKTAILPIIALLAVFLWNFQIDSAFYKSIGKAVMENISDATNSNMTQDYFSSAIYSVKIHFIYGTLGFIILGVLGILFFLKKKNFYRLIPFLIILPSFVYLIESSISSDHPWMLRRFVFSIFPVFILYSLMLLMYLKENWRQNFFLKTAPILLATALLIGNLPPLLKYLAFSENKNLLAQTEELSRNFSGNDLILVDRLASDDGWSILAAPLDFLHNKNAVYFFNPKDLDKLNLEKFDKIYLVTPEENENLWKNSVIGNKLVFHKNYSLSTTRLQKMNKQDTVTRLPKKEKIEVKGKIFEIK